MQFPESWLRSLVNPPLTSRALADQLTMAGLEVEGLEPAGKPFTGVVVAQVLAVEPHPGADRLRVCKVNAGADASALQIVCGAPNVAVGQKVPCARVGARLPNMEIRQAKVRGVESSGMLCGASEIGLEDKVDGLLVLPGEAPVGTDIRQYLELDDYLFTLKLTPNRADCLSLTGIAREVAAITGSKLSLPMQPPVVQEIYNTLEIEIKAPEACSRYMGRVIKDINARATTPDWMVARLERCGVRSISAPVDITNYVLLETGQPMHAFDLTKLGERIQVRWAKPGEKLTLLNEQTADLAEDMLVIADANGPLALAGIMGGLPSAVTGGTSDIFLECAWFSPDSIAGRARRLGLNTDASHRFERGVDYAMTSMAMERATKLMLEICGGHPGPVVEKKTTQPKREAIRFRPQRAARLLGMNLTADIVRKSFRQLGLGVKEGEGHWMVTPPSYRFDLSIEEDLVEEIARMYGYDKVEARVPIAAAMALPQAETALTASSLQRYLIGRDYQEVVTYSFVDPEWEKLLSAGLPALPLLNPIASQMGVMRTTLWGGLLSALTYNLNRQQQRVRIFEVGRAYLAQAGTLRQPQMLAGLCHGLAFDEQWGTIARPVDFYDVKGDLERIPGLVLDFEAAGHPALHPGQSARILSRGKPAGWLGTLNPKLVRHFDLPAAPILFELEVDCLGYKELPSHRPIPRFPSVRRDLAFVVDQKITAEALMATMRQASSPAVREIEVFDLYQGQGIPAGQKSLAFRVVIQDTDRTLTDSEIEETVVKIAQTVTSVHDAKLRT